MAETVRSTAASPARDPVTFREMRVGHAWTVRGDARAPAFADRVEALLGPLPVEPLTSTRTADATLFWLGPRAWLFTTGAAAPPRDFDAARGAINAAGGALFDVSASYMGWAIAGVHAGRVLGRECPLDLRPRSFPAGRCAQSLLGHIGVLVYRPREAPCYVMLIARSYASDAWHTLTTAASSEGHRVESPIDVQSA